MMLFLLWPVLRSTADNAHAAEGSHGAEEYHPHPVFNDEEPRFQLAGSEDQKIVSDGIDDFTDYQEQSHGLNFLNATGDEISTKVSLKAVDY